MPPRAREVGPAIFLLVAVALTVTIYLPGLTGGWLLDDTQNIVHNTDLQQPASLDSLWSAAISDRAGPLRRPISMLTFWANYHAGAGLNPRPYKITNLAIHILNGLAAFWFLCGLFTAIASKRHEVDVTRIRWAAAVAATLWLVHPLALTNILYVVQRMNSLAGGFTLLAVGMYVHGRNRLERTGHGWRWIALGVFLFTPLAALSKENGILALLFMWTIEYFVYQFDSNIPSTRRWLRYGHSALLLLPAGIVAIYIGTHIEWLLAPYHFRTFTLTERLMTESRVLWRYVGWIVAPTPARLGLAHDDIPISTGLLDPPTTLISILALLVTIGAALRFRKKYPLFGFVVAWFLAGQILESTAIGLEISFEHRLYLSMLGPLAAVAYTAIVSQKMSFAFAQKTFVVGGILVLAFVTYVRATEWSDNLTLSLYEVHHHPDSARANAEAGITFADLMDKPGADKDYDRDQAMYHWKRAAELDQSDPTSVFNLALIRGANGLPFDADFIKWSIQRLHHRPMHPRILNGFETMVRWLQNGKAKIPQHVVISLFEAALSNPGISAKYRAAIYAQMSAYYANVLRDPQTAVSLAIAAVREHPSEPIHHLDLAQLAIELHRFDIAREQLDTANKLDRLGGYILERRRLEKVLRQAEQKSTQSGLTDKEPSRSGSGPHVGP